MKTTHCHIVLVLAFYTVNCAAFVPTNLVSGRRTTSQWAKKGIPATAESQDWGSMNIRELKQELRSRGMKFTAFTKPELLKALKEFEELDHNTNMADFERSREELGNGEAVENGVKDMEADSDPTSKDYYFDSYSHFGIHEEMLKDEVRTRSYMNAIERNAAAFKGKTVLDVGCGTGILCMFAARAGASKVIGVECSGIAEQARQIIADNGFSDTIEIIRGKVEEIELPVEKVDIIISEWMGYFLLYESMLDTVLYARDKWLAPGGLLLPDQAVLYVAAIEDGDYRQEKIDFWDDVYGFKMGCIKSLALTEPLVDQVEGRALTTNAVPVLTVDINTCTKEALDFAGSFTLTAQRTDGAHALVAYFDVGFRGLPEPLYFSTGPRARYTHWKQTVFYLHEPLPVVNEGEQISGEISCARNKKNPRDLDIHIKLDFDGEDGSQHSSTDYRLR